MDPYRTNKMTHAILEVLSELLQSQVKDPRVGFVTLGGVKLNRDHSVAEVFFTVMGEGANPEQSLEGLKKARGFLQGKLAKTLGLRTAPELRFTHDETLERSVALDSVLNELKDKGEFLTEEQKRRRLCLDDLQPPAHLLTALRLAKVVWVVPHHNPDPDATGSALALGEALAAMGREVRVLGYPDPPVGLLDLPGFGDLLLSDDAPAAFAAQPPDTVVLVDCHRIDRTGPLEETLARCETRLSIDHHLVSGRRSPEPGWLEARSCSTCTLIHQVIVELAKGDAGEDGDGDPPFELTHSMATNLYAGLVNDTGGFRFDNTAPFSFELARRLSAMGVDTALVAKQTLHRYRRAGIELMQRVLATFTWHDRDRILSLYATRAMLAETGGSMTDTEGFVNIATAVDGVRYVIFLKEIGDETWRASLRVRGDGDVQQVAARYGGGGHRAAAGCTIEGGLEQVLADLVAQLAALPGA
ncbi:30S ribosome-binding factor RbfA [bacterium]|nr:30S ribosome-binding factor RbfA [bacterium]